MDFIFYYITSGSFRKMILTKDFKAGNMQLGKEKAFLISHTIHSENTISEKRRKQDELDRHEK